MSEICGYLFFVILAIIFAFYLYDHFKMRPREIIDKLKASHDIVGLMGFLDKRNSEWVEDYCINAIIEIANDSDKVEILTTYMGGRLSNTRLLNSIDIAKVLGNLLQTKSNPVITMELILFYYQNGMLARTKFLGLDLDNVLRQMLLMEVDAEKIRLITAIRDLQIVKANQWIDFGIIDAIGRLLKTEECNLILQMYKLHIVPNEIWVDLGLSQRIDLLIEKILKLGDAQRRINLFKILVNYYEEGLLNSSQKAKLIMNESSLKEVGYTYYTEGEVTYEEVFGYGSDGVMRGDFIRHSNTVAITVKLWDYWPEDNFSSKSQ